MEYKRKCLTCGKIYCYTDKDVKENQSNAAMGAISAVGSLASIFGGTIFHTAHLTNQTNRYTDKVVDFNRCPNCNSSNTIECIGNEVDNSSAPVSVEEPHKRIEINSNATPQTLLARAFMFLEDREWDTANAYAEACLDLEPENTTAYIVKLLVDLKVSTEEGLIKCKKPFDNNKNYKKAIRFAEPETVATLKNYIDKINQRNEQNELKKAYKRAVEKMEGATKVEDFVDAQKCFDAISDYKDSARLMSKCKELADEALKQEEIRRKEKIYNEAKERIANDKNSLDSYFYAIANYRKIFGYRDSKEQIEICEKKIEEIRAERKRQEELYKQQKEKEEKRTRVIVWLVVLACIFVVALVVILNKFVFKPNEYASAQELYNAENYSEAIDAFNELGYYKDSKDMVNEAKYGYVNSHLNNSDETTYEYLDYLKSIDYKDSSKIYDELYAWEIKIIANTSKTNKTKDVDKIGATDTLCFHYFVNGGYPDEPINLDIKVDENNGLVDSWTDSLKSGEDANISFTLGSETKWAEMTVEGDGIVAHKRVEVKR